MSLKDKIKRLKEGLDAEQDPDLIQSTKAIIQGMTFYHLGIGTELAQKRWDDHCKGCEFNVPDPVSSVAVQDKKIPEMSSRMCSHCGGCVLSYKTRQSVKKCEFWNE